MTFSERNAGKYGIAPKKPMQMESMDEKLKDALWICLEEIFESLGQNSHRLDSVRARYRNFLEIIWTQFRYINKPKSQLIGINEHHIVHSKIQSYYDKFSWDEVYSFVEFIARLLPLNSPELAKKFKECSNNIFEDENSAWRFVGNFIIPITSPIEIEEIEYALSIQDEASQHIESAIALLSNKERDQTRESIAQAMSAPEAIIKKVTGDTNGSLSSLYNHSKILPTHPQFRQALLNLYNFASGKDGYRHALTEGSEPSNRPLAQFILVTCSAFVNLIKSEASITNTKN